MSLIRRVPWTVQPQYAAPISRAGYGSRLRRAVNLAMPSSADLAEGVLITYSAGAVPVTRLARSNALGLHFSNSGTANNGIVAMPSWTNTTSEGSACVVFEVIVQGGANMWNFGSTGTADHFPFGGQVYSDAFWGSRWASGVSPPSGLVFTGFKTIVWTVRSGRQRMYVNGVLWASNTLTGSFTLPATLEFFKERTDTLGFAGFAWDVALDDAYAQSVSLNPWQLFEPRRIIIPVSAGAAPTFNPAWAIARNSAIVGAGVH